MSSRASESAQRNFHRYVAVLFAISFPALALMELLRMDNVMSTQAPIRWICFLIITIWAVWVLRQPGPNALPLVVATTIFVASLSMVEVLVGVDVSTLDFSTSFGLVMMLAVLTGVLTAGNRLVWSGALGATVAIWAVAMGVLRQDPLDLIGIRAVVAVAGVIFTTALISMLYDQLGEVISRYEEAARLQHAIATCSEALLVQTDAFAVYEALRALLEATDADYAYVDVNTTTEDSSTRWEIVADARKRASVAQTSSKSGVYSPGSLVYEALSRGRAYVVHTEDLQGEERSVYEKDGILSEVVVPIVVSGELRGSVGFVDFTTGRAWREEEVQTLWRAAHMIGAYWRRQDDQEQLRASNESKDRLLASVSHELRTPLAAIVGLSELIVASRVSLDEAELDELNGIIAVQSRELAELVEDLLVASRAESGSLSISADWTKVRSEVEQVLRGVRESHPSSKVFEVVGDESTAWADALRCRQVIRNLITNAIKYGGNAIAIRVMTGDGMITVAVCDNGEGVPAEEEELIFERYYRSHHTATQPGSVGIGLAVSRQLAEMMGGTLRYMRVAKGSCFLFSVPDAPPETVSTKPVLSGIHTRG